MEQATAERTVRELFETIRAEDRWSDIAHGFEITAVESEPEESFGLPGLQERRVTATLSVPVLAHYRPFQLVGSLEHRSHPAVDRSNLDALRAHVERRLATRRITAYALASGPRWNVEPHEDPEPTPEATWAVTLTLTVR